MVQLSQNKSPNIRCRLPGVAVTERLPAFAYHRLPSHGWDGPEECVCEYFSLSVAASFNLYFLATAKNNCRTIRAQARQGLTRSALG